jgi:hypothetical protein
MTKLLLALIAAGLWANAVVAYTRPARADTADYLTSLSMEKDLDNISQNTSAMDADLETLTGPGCTNTKLCP